MVKFFKIKLIVFYIIISSNFSLTQIGDFKIISTAIWKTQINSDTLSFGEIDSEKIIGTETNAIETSKYFYNLSQGSGLANRISAIRKIEENQKHIPSVETSFEALPILSYDTDVGFGYGAKFFLLNYLHKKESFDVVLFNSTKGERWYRLVFSLPDFEMRHGKIYSFAWDFVVDYDKWINNSFFGVGNNSKFANREYYSREPIELSITASRGFNRLIVGQFGATFKSIRNFNFSETGKLKSLSPKINSETARYFSFFSNIRYDSRNSFINPSDGFVLQVEAEHAPSFEFTNSSFSRIAGTIQQYSMLSYFETILAVRFSLQGLFGDNLPVQTLLSIGGNKTLRGYPQDRFLDKILAITNGELRFPIFWRFGGIAGIDIGKVWQKFSEINFNSWVVNQNLGLRFYMDSFIVRLDIGFGKESTGFYFNFGHIF